MYISKSFFAFSLFLFVLYSCVPHKKLIYFQKGKILGDTVMQMKDVYKLQPTDVLSIDITSFNSAATDFFNSKANTKQQGYLINSNGYIHLPILDSLYVKDKTLQQVKDTLERLIGEHATKPYIVVNLANFKFTTLGEFSSKGIVSTINNELTILEAISLSGDLSELADRRHLKLMRKEGDKTIFVTLDLTNRDIMLTPYFYVHPNDVLYAEPLKVKSLRTNLSQVGLYFGILSFGLLLYNYIRPNK